MNTTVAGGPLRISRVAASYQLFVSRDTQLHPEAVSTLLTCAIRVAKYEPLAAVIVGATRCARSGELVAGGLNRRSAHSRRFLRVGPAMAPLPVDTFDPCCLLVPDVVADAIASRAVTPNLGLRLHRMGFAVFLAPEFVGTTERAGGVASRVGL